MGGEQLLDVVLEPKLGMNLRPVVGGTNEAQEDHEMLKQRVGEGLRSASRQRAACGVCKKTCVAQAKTASSIAEPDSGDEGRCGAPFQKRQMSLQRVAPRQRAADQPNDLLDGLRER